MIDDAWPWKLELHRLLQQAQGEYADPKLFPDAVVDADSQQIFLVERLAFVTALVMRKLAEAGKVSVQFLSASIWYDHHPIRDPRVAPDQLSMHRATDFYEEEGTPRRMPYGGFANMLIHSKAFVTCEQEDEEGQLNAYGFAVTSDRSHFTHLAVFTMHDVQTFILRLLEDDIVQKVVIRDGHGAHISVGSRTSMDPEELHAYLDRAPHKETAREIRQLIAGRFGE